METTIECLKSLCSEASRIAEVMILDNGGPHPLPSPLELTLPYTLSCFSSADNLGFAGGMNRLIEEAMSRPGSLPMLFLNNDTRCTPPLLSPLLENLQEKLILAPQIFNLDGEPDQWAGDFDTTMMKTEKAHIPLDSHELYPVGILDGSCFLAPRAAFADGTRFDESLFLYFEDIDLFLRLKKRGFSFAVQRGTHLVHTEGGSTSGPKEPSPLRNHYFFRNRLSMAKRIHSPLRRWRVYYRIIALAREAQKASKGHPKAQAAIRSGIIDFFLGRKGRSPLF